MLFTVQEKHSFELHIIMFWIIEHWYKKDDIPCDVC